jgi:hypothetical protein
MSERYFNFINTSFPERRQPARYAGRCRGGYQGFSRSLQKNINYFEIIAVAWKSKSSPAIPVASSN